MLIYIWLFAMMIMIVIGCVAEYIPMPLRVEVILVGILAGVMPSCALFTNWDYWWIGLIGFAATAVIMWPSVKHTTDNLK